MADETQAKWECEYCTFRNWQASKKCTICHASRPLKFISEHEGVPDIYEVASQEKSEDSGARLVQYHNADRWTCNKCTYMNWSKSKKCIVCLSPPHHNKNEADFGGNLATAMEPLSIDTSGSHATSSHGSNKTSPSCTSPQDENNDKNRVSMKSVIRNLQNKWLCKTCSYENWPKSAKCSMCGTLRSNSIRDLSTIGASQNLSPNALVSSVRSPPNSPRGAAASIPSSKPNKKSTCKSNSAAILHRLHDRLSEIDYLWLKACTGIIEGDRLPVDAYLAVGGDAARQVSADEIQLLGPQSLLQKGQTLVHLAVQCQREDILALLLTANVTPKTRKRLPPHVCPDLANEILRTVACSLRQRKGDLPCFFLTESVTFALPADIEDLLPAVEKQVLNDTLDQDVQKELELEEGIINWSIELCERFGSRLFALWNRSAGDCLLDSVLQATWGVFDKDNTLRLALSDSLTEGAMSFYPRWKEYESQQAQFYAFTLDEDQWHQDWTYILNLASQPGSALEQTHIFALAHILRRPIIVYGVKYVKSFRGETIDLAKFQGLYLPLLWESSFCWKSPITLGYTRGHFSALVPMEVDLDKNMGAGAMIDNQDEKVVYLPLVDKDGEALPLHFLTQSQIKRERAILNEWLVCRDVAGIYCAEQRHGRQPPLVKQMVEEWLDRYRQLSQAMRAAGVCSRKSRQRVHRVSSDYETDDE